MSRNDVTCEAKTKVLNYSCLIVSQDVNLMGIRSTMRILALINFESSQSAHREVRTNPCDNSGCCHLDRSGLLWVREDEGTHQHRAAELGGAVQCCPDGDHAALWGVVVQLVLILIMPPCGWWNN